MVKIFCKKTISVWGKLCALFLSLFSFSTLTKASYSDDMKGLESSYKKIMYQTDLLKKKLEALSTTSSSDTNTYKNLLNELSQINSEKSVLDRKISEMKNKVYVSSNSKGSSAGYNS